MTRSKLVVAMLLAFGLLVGVYSHASAGAAPSSTQPTGQHPVPVRAAKPGEECHVTHVQLSGVGAGQVTCLDSKKTAHNPGPYLVQDNCTNSLEIFTDAYQSGYAICFSGNGFTNLTYFEYCDAFFCYSWNDTATSWASHSQSGAMYSNIDGNGTHMFYYINSLGNFTSNPIPNDSLSSVCIGTCPYV